MKALLVAGVLALAGTPTLAFEAMTQTDCRAALERLSRLMDDSVAKTERLVEATHVTPQGWCEIRNDGITDAKFDKFEWRAEGIARWIKDGIPPLALEFRMTGLDPDQMQNSADTERPTVDVSAILRHVPDAGQVIVERAVMDNNAGDVLSVSGVFERLFLSSPAMMQVSFGSATFKTGLVSLTLDGAYENPFGFRRSFNVQGTPQAQRNAAFTLISNLPDGVFSDESRAELTAFAGDLPKPVGTLEIVVNSRRGLGIVQLGVAAAMTGATLLTENADTNQLEILFDGLSVNADWAPAAQIAD